MPIPLKTKEERVKLLKAGFTGRQIELIYILLNGFEILSVNWVKNTVEYS